jgi:hypothetical protein
MAVGYVKRACAIVEAGGLLYQTNPLTGAIEWYAGRTKTVQPRAELARIENRWARASSDMERIAIAGDAESLADRVEENLPGAPQDRTRTNLLAREDPKSTPATSYPSEVLHQATEVFHSTVNAANNAWDWTAAKAHSVGDGASHVGNWLLGGGALLVAWKGLELFRERQTGQKVERALNASLGRAASSARNGGAGVRGYFVRWPETDLYYRVVRDNGGRRILVVPLTDEARDAVADRDAVSFMLPDGSYGDAFNVDAAHYERVSKPPRWVFR